MSDVRPTRRSGANLAIGRQHGRLGLFVDRPVGPWCSSGPSCWSGRSPAATVLTRTPRRPTSTAIDWVSWATPALQMA